MWQHNRPKTFYSVLGAYAYNDKLFDNFVLHEDINIDKNSLIEYIIYENADLPLHVVNLDLLKIKIGLWCKKNKENWLRIYEALYQKYNPLHNFDRYEELSDETTGNVTKDDTNTLSATGNSKDTHNLKDETTYGKKITTDTNELTNGSNTGTETNAHENTAFNAVLSITARDTITKDLSDNTEKNIHDVSQESGKDTINHTGTLQTDTKNTENQSGHETINNTNSAEHNGHLYGNIGVTTSQKMLQDEIDVRFNNNFYDIISSQFKLEFCVMIY